MYYMFEQFTEKYSVSEYKTKKGESWYNCSVIVRTTNLIVRIEFS